MSVRPGHEIKCFGRCAKVEPALVVVANDSQRLKADTVVHPSGALWRAVDGNYREAFSRALRLDVHVCAFLVEQVTDFDYCYCHAVVD